MTEAWAETRVLVIDDEPGMLRAVARVLQRGYAVETCQDPLAAVDLARDFRPDIALLDIRMPGLDGFSLMRRLMKEDAGLDVILMTGNFDEADADLMQAIEDGAFYYLQKPIDRRVLLALMSRCVERRRLRRQHREHAERMERELQGARRFQLSLLPPPSASRDGFEVQAWMQPCNELAGDVYDYAFLAPDCLALLVADVMGHGAAAAMLTGLVKSCFQSVLGPDFEPLDFVTRLRAALTPFEEGTFVTAFAAKWRAGSQSRLTFANAGHPPSLLFRHQGVALLESTGPIVSSFFELEQYQAESVELDRGDVLVAYSDGLTEQRVDDQPFGRDRLERAALEALRRRQHPTSTISQAWQEFTQGQAAQDDVTLLAALRPGPGL